MTTVNEVNELFVPEEDLETYLAEAKSLPTLKINKVRAYALPCTQFLLRTYSAWKYVEFEFAVREYASTWTANENTWVVSVFFPTYDST